MLGSFRFGDSRLIELCAAFPTKIGLGILIFFLYLQSGLVGQPGFPSVLRGLGLSKVGCRGGRLWSRKAIAAFVRKIIFWSWRNRTREGAFRCRGVGRFRLPRALLERFRPGALPLRLLLFR